MTTAEFYDAALQDSYTNNREIAIRQAQNNALDKVMNIIRSVLNGEKTLRRARAELTLAWVVADENDQVIEAGILLNALDQLPAREEL